MIIVIVPNLYFSHLQLNVKNELIYHQIKLLNTNRKPNFYCICKEDTLKTEFLDTIKNPLDKKCINKFRLGNHKLRVETGRHTVPKTPENLRICSFCHSEITCITFLLAQIFSCKIFPKKTHTHFIHSLSLLRLAFARLSQLADFFWEIFCKKKFELEANIIHVIIIKIFPHT